MLARRKLQGKETPKVPTLRFRTVSSLSKNALNRRDSTPDSPKSPDTPSPTKIPGQSFTMTVPVVSAPTGANSANGAIAGQQTETVIVTMPPPLPPQQPKRGLSEGTEHLLIAAGSIGATIILVLVVYGLFLMRKKRMTFRDLLYMLRGRKAARVKAKAVGDWKDPDYADYTWNQKDLPVAPLQPVYRPSTRGSNRPPPIAIIQQPTYENITLTRGPSNRSIAGRTIASQTRRVEGQNATFYNDRDTETQRNAPPVYVQAASRSSDSPTLLPLQNPPASQPKGGYDRNDEAYDTLGPMNPVIADPFRQLEPGRHLSGPKVSRFSWTTAQTPHTPRTPLDRHVSVATSRSSVPRFRTVDSWVNQQTNRVIAQQIKEDLEREPSVPIPNVPRHYRSITNGSEATVFRHHPGTEVVIPRGSLVPSEILNTHTPAPTL